MTGKLFLVGLLVSLFSGCVEEDIRRLQTNQSYEGEEAFLISSLLDEHLYLLWQPLSFFSDTTNTAMLRGCPVVRVDSLNNEVTLDFDGVICSDESGVRSGSMALSYTLLPQTQGYRVSVAYRNYSFAGNTISGTRTIAVTAQNRSRRVFSDTSFDLFLLAKNQSSSRVSFNLTHEVTLEGTNIIQGRSTGVGTGRNWVGRAVNWEVVVPKTFPFACPGMGKSRPSEGQETWTITRSGTTAVAHRLTFFSEDGCSTHTVIRLDEGVEMKKAP
nr:hypothetical protein [Cytophagales bacterium]